MIMGTTVASSYTAIAFGIFIVVVLLWTFAVKGLDKSIKNINANASN